MPELNGLELAYRLRGHHRTAGVPILMFSEMGEAPDALVGYAAGADDYLPKPFELTISEAKVQAMLRRAAGMTGKANRGKVILFAHAKGALARPRSRSTSPCCWRRRHRGRSGCSTSMSSSRLGRVSEPASQTRHCRP